MIKTTDFQTIPPKAQEYICNGAPKPIAQMLIDEIPPVAISWGRTTVFKTGSWRNITPHYIKRLPPCRSGCPVGNDIEGWLEAAGERKWDDAVRLLLAEQPLPAVSGRVCYHPCETACNRTQLDEAVSIRTVERYLGDRANRLGILPDKIDTKSNTGRILIIGSGPAGLAAAWLLVRLGHNVEIHEKAPKPGGLLRYGIPAYRLPRNILDNDLKRIEHLGVMINCNAPLDPKNGLVSLKRNYDAVFLSPGAASHRNSGIEGETSGFVISAIPFLANAAIGRKPDLGANVAVIGGGNSAVDAARTALRMGSRVVILYRRTRAEMPAYEEEVEAAIAEGVEIEFLVNPVSISRNSKELHIRCIRNKLGEPDASGRRRPVPVPGSEFEIPINTVIDAVGETLDPQALTLDTEETCLLEPIDLWGRTDLDGIWIGGDFAERDRTVAYAIATGKRSAIAIDRYLQGNTNQLQESAQLGDSIAVSAEAYINGNQYDNHNPVSFSDLNIAYHPLKKRSRQRERIPDERQNDFDEIVSGLTAASIAREAGRCFHCGSCDSCGNCHVFCPDGAVLRDPKTSKLSFNLDYCKGCSICATECPRAAIELKK
ncbi:MAG: NAD(P)-binding protein [Candidatus Hatepunaea meridiana]|nr:NAD(P)-binding protein [Candidatus Hatepunaea meridiana]